MIEEIKRMPKVELHLHLDGSINPVLASKLSNLPLEQVKDKMIASEKCNDLTEYLTKFDFPISLMQTKENLVLVAESLAKRLEKENVIYAEIRFAPMFHTKKGLSYDEIITSVLEGLALVKKVKTNLILCLMRGASDKDNDDTLKSVIKFMHKGVCAIDLAGDEKHYPTYLYEKYFIKAKMYNIPFTIHAGEAGGSDEIDKALEFGALRIGHGVHSVENINTYNRLIKQNILLELCPTSNIQTNAISTYNMHPIKKMYNDNMSISINTDNSTVSNVSITDEYIKLYNVFNFTLDDFKKMNEMAIKHAFINDEEKERLISVL